VERILTPDEAADVLRVPAETLAYWRRTATGPEYYMSGKHVRYCESDLEEWVRKQKADQAEKTRQRAEAVSAQ
jgi:excisionase family DNA binding protein